MCNGVLGARPFGVLVLLEIARIMKQDREQAELEHPLGQWRLGSGEVAPMQQPHHAQSPLERVLEIVITGIHRLVVPIAPGKALDGPAKDTRDEQRSTTTRKKQTK